MLLLDAINQCARAVGLGYVNAESDTDGETVIIKTVLKRERRSILANAYIFNTNKVTLAVDVSGRVPIDASYLKIFIPDVTNLTWRDDPDSGNNRFIWDQDANDWYAQELKNVEVTFDMEDFSRIPELFAQWIAARSANEHWSDKHDSSFNQKLEVKAALAGGRAVNSLPPCDINNSTRWNSLRSSSASAAVNVAGSLIALP